MLALITGASSGLGLALSHALFKQGYSLILVARNEEKLKETAAHLPSSTQTICADLSQREHRKVLIDIIHQKQPDLIINNAGFGLYGPAHTQPLSELKEMVEVNIEALLELSIEGAKAMLQARKKGRILNISSAAAFFSYPTFSVYAATKAFVNSFSESLDAEMKRHEIRVYAACPGQIDTNFRAKASRNHPQQKDNMTMSAETAAKLILKEMEKNKPIFIVDWRYRIMVAISRLLPKRLLQGYLERSLKDRYVNHRC